MKTIISRYAQLPGNKPLVFRALCSLLTENSAEIYWSEFGDQEWKLFAKMATGENVAEMAYYILKTKPLLFHLADVDPNTFKTLQKVEAITSLRNAVLFKELDKILFTLHKNSIPVISLKGIDLARFVYPNPGLRSMGDIDILVRKTDFQFALELVSGLGYHDYLLDSKNKLIRLLDHHACLQKNIPTHPILELHWILIACPEYKYSVSMDWFWENSEYCNCFMEKNYGEKFQKSFHLNPTANLLYLSAHQMLQHGESSINLRFLLDISLLLKNFEKEIEWNKLLKQSQVYDWSRALELTLNAVQECFQVEIPREILSTLNKISGKNDSIITLKQKTSSSILVKKYKVLRSLNWKVLLRSFFAHYFP